jgi:hypothetical protein
MKPLMSARRIMRDSIRVYFAPLVGAFKGIRAELQRTDRLIEQHRMDEAEKRRDPVGTALCE